MTSWSGAELRARLNYLGFSVPAFAICMGRDARYINRIVTGVVGSTSASIMEAVRMLDAQARVELEQWDQATEQGETIYIPSLGAKQEPRGLPPHWYLALASRHIAKWGADAQVEWAE